MKRHILPLTLLAFTLLVAACHQPTPAPRLHTQNDTLSWAMGENIALALQEMQGVGLDNDIVAQAIQHTLEGGEQPISDSVYRAAMKRVAFLQHANTMQKNNQTKAQVDRQQEQYFAQLMKENKAVRKHPAGFYYEEVKEGKGTRAQLGQRIKFDYRSYLLFSGEAYDQTYGKREPIIHVVGKPMFEGLVEAIQLMNAGSIYRFYFPYQLAFGEKGSGNIPGYTPFIYEVELHEIYNN